MRWPLLLLSFSVCTCGGRIVPEAEIRGWCTSQTCAVRIIATSEGWQFNAAGMAVGGGYVYWSTEHQIVRAPLSGGAPEVFAPSDEPSWIVADATNVYWSQWDHTVMQQPHKGGRSLLLRHGDREPRGAMHLAVDPSAVYWGHDHEVVRVPIGGGPEVTLATGRGLLPVAVAGDRLYFSTNTSLMSIGTDGLELTTVMLSQRGDALAIDETDIYWGGSGAQSPALLRISRGGGPPVVVSSAFSGNQSFDRLCVDDDAIYFLGEFGSDFGPLRKVSKRGGALSTITEIHALAFTVSGGNVYWAAMDGTSPTRVTIKTMPARTP